MLRFYSVVYDDNLDLSVCMVGTGFKLAFVLGRDWRKRWKESL